MTIPSNAAIADHPGSRPIDLDAFRRTALNCALPVAIDMIGEKWSFLILRGALNDLKHFEEFQAGLGIARNILANRLARMVEAGILDRRRDPADRRRLIYSLTPKGEGLLPVVIALRQWGEDWGGGQSAIQLTDTRDGQPIRRIRVESHDGRALGLDELMWRNLSTGESLSRRTRPRLTR